MKQHITKKQLNELDRKEKEKLLDWLLNKNYFFIATNIPAYQKKSAMVEHLDFVGYNLSIGQMIEFLYENKIPVIRINSNPVSWYVRYGGSQYNNAELVDALWEAVKEVLRDEKR